ncbi:MAG: GAF domain-containing protein, partial [Dehalococcoidia bacterium]
LVPVDRLVLGHPDPANPLFTNTHVWGIPLVERPPRGAYPVAGTIIEEVTRTGSSLLLQGMTDPELSKRRPGLITAGCRSFLGVPLVSDGKVAAVLVLRALKPNAYSERHVAICEQIANQVAGSVATSRLYEELQRADQALGKSEAVERQLANENAIIAEIGRIVSSSPDLNEVCPPFVERLRRLIQCDRVILALRDDQDSVVRVIYREGPSVPGRGLRFQVPLKGSLSMHVMDTRTTALVQDTSDGIVLTHPELSPTVEAGIRSILAVPLISGDRSVGIIHLQSFTPGAFGNREARLGEAVATQIAGAFANASLNKQLEEQVREQSALAEISRVVSSTLDTYEVCERFVEQMRTLINFDNAALSTVKPQQGLISNLFVWEHDASTASRGDSFPLKGTIAEEVTRTQSPILVQGDDTGSMDERFPGLGPEFVNGFASFLAIPLVSRGQVVAVLVLRSVAANAYSERDIVMGERLAAQVSGAIATSQINAELQQVGEALRQSEEAERRAAEENAALAEISRIVTSSMDIDAIYEQFAHQVARLIPSDRIALTTIDAHKPALRNLHVWGLELSGRPNGTSQYPFDGTLGEEIIRTGSSVLVQGEDDKSLTMRFPNLAPGPFKSFLGVPVVSHGREIAVLFLRSLKSNAYTQQDVALAERIAAQISGAIENAQLYEERAAAQETLKENEGRYRRLVESAPLAIIVHQEGNLVYANKSAASLLGAKSARQLKSVSLSDFVHPYYRDSVLARAREAMTEGRPTAPHTEKMERLDGQIRDVEMVSVPFAHDGKAATQVLIRDITEVKRAEEERSMLAALVENSPDFIAFMPLDDMVHPLFINKAGLRMLGVNSVEEVRIRPKTDFLDNDNVRDFLRDVLPVITEIGSWAGETEIRNARTGEWMPVHLHIFNVTNPETGKPVALGTITRDMSGMKRDREERARLATLVENSAEAVSFVMLDDRLTLSFVNSRAARLMNGESPEDIIGRPLSDFVDSDRIRQIRSEVIPAVTKMGFWVEEATTLDPDTGEQMNIRRHWFAVNNPETDEPAALGAITHDITALKQAEAANVQLGALVENSPDFISVAPIDDPCTPSFINHAGLRMIGVDSLDERLSMPGSKATRDGRRKYLRNVVPRVLEEGSCVSETMYENRKTGESVPVHRLSFLIHHPSTGEPAVIGTIARDITELKRAEQERELRARAEAARKDVEQAAQARGEIIASVSHEFRNPLTSVIAFADILRRNNGSGLSERQLKQVEAIARNARHIEGLMDELNDLLRLESGELTLDWSVFDAREMLDSLAVDLEAALRYRRQTLSFKQPGGPINIESDRTRLSRLLTNLIDNACRHSPAGSEIEVRVEDTESKIILDVADNPPQGTGKTGPPTMFSDVGADRNWPLGPRELGFYISKISIERMGGRLSVGGSHESGASVHLEIPLLKPS